MTRRGAYKKLSPGTSRASLQRYRAQVREGCRLLAGGGDWVVTEVTPGRVIVDRRDAPPDEDNLLNQQLAQAKSHVVSVKRALLTLFP